MYNSSLVCIDSVIIVNGTTFVSMLVVCDIGKTVCLYLLFIWNNKKQNNKMEKNIKEKSLLDVLSYCDLRSLPKEDDKKYVWVKAVGLVEKNNGSQNYVVLKRDENGGFFVCKDFGTTATIVKVKKVFPYDFLNADVLPDFGTSKKDVKIQWLLQNGVKGDLSSLTSKELDKLCVNVAIKKQLNNSL